MQVTAFDNRMRVAANLSKERRNVARFGVIDTESWKSV